MIIVRLPQKEEKKAEVPVEIKEYTVKGTVVDASGQPLPGVNITVQGTTNGVTTDLSGGFTLRIRDGKRVLLVASYIGFSTRKVWVSGETNSLKIMLEESSASLNEVVVVGYGTQKKLNLTGAVTTASGEILENRPIANIAQGLQGMVPNLNITFNSGQPNEAAKINIRGNTSLNGGNALILVDGVEISDLSLINPQDVESVSVLKDASAAAVYGARAAFGRLSSVGVRCFRACRCGRLFIGWPLRQRRLRCVLTVVLPRPECRRTGVFHSSRKLFRQRAACRPAADRRSALCCGPRGPAGESGRAEAVS